MFDRISGVYDRMNRIMTAGLDRTWRARAAERSRLAPGDSALDLCCGTGDVALELAARVGPEGEVTGADFSRPMLDLASGQADPARVRRRSVSNGPTPSTCLTKMSLSMR